IMPYYNGRKYTDRAVRSVLDQTYKNIEIIVVDDASPDPQDAEYIKDLSKKLGFKLITHHTNKGIARTMADAAIASTGQYIAELSQDDLYKTKKIEQQLNELTTKNLDAVYALGDTFDDETGKLTGRDYAKTKKIIDTGQASHALKLQNLPCISIQGLMAKRSVFENDIIPIWNDFLLDDWPVNIRLFDKYNVAFIDTPLWTARSHSLQTSHNRWKWLGPQIEVIARMVPYNLKAEGIGNRLASMARRLQKQNKQQNDVIRFSFAGLILTESADQQKKASRVLGRISSKQKKQILAPLLSPSASAAEHDLQTTLTTDWQNLGKNIADASALKESERLNAVSQNFASLASNLLPMESSSADAVKFALAAMVLTDDPQQISQITHLLQSSRHDKLIKQKLQLLKTKSRQSLKLFWKALP
ncbi:MAG: glycosyltransferase family 2 protein, partial [Sedimentisphaerales bacterium]|nr:glycosyltransferase family 2 protein [Sedimentisphaerales bacterium]